MAIEKDFIYWEGERALLDAGHLAIATLEGWTATIKDAEDNDIPNPKTAREVAFEWVKKQVRERVETYNRIQLNQQVEAGMAQVGQVLNSITTGYGSE